jgi:hypothetical protein
MTMHKLRFVPILTLAAGLALAACEAGSKAQNGNPDAQGAGQSPERGQGTVANDTAPARPGQPTQASPPGQPGGGS